MLNCQQDEDRDLTVALAVSEGTGDLGRALKAKSDWNGIRDNSKNETENTARGGSWHRFITKRCNNGKKPGDVFAF